jgi:hypothetical protein
MKDKTAMQEMLEWVRKTLPMDLDTPRMIEEKIESLLVKEKEQIIGAHNDGALMACALPFNAPFKKGEEYYNETYGSQAPQRLSEANGE